MMAAALATVMFVEGFCRSLGFVTAPRYAVQLAPLVRLIEIVLAPVLRAGIALDTCFERLLPPPTVAQRAEQLEEAAEQFRQVVAAEADVLARRTGAAARRVLAGRHTGARHHGAACGTSWASTSPRRGAKVVDRVRSSEHARFPCSTTRSTTSPESSTPRICCRS
jgi:hypothetical protein